MKDGTLDGIGAALARLKPPMPSGLARGLHFPSGTSGGFRTARRESVQCLCFSFVAMVATGQFFQFFRFQHSQERELFMRIQNSFAAAVAAAVSAVVFSAAMQPVQASLVFYFEQINSGTVVVNASGSVNTTALGAPNYFFPGSSTPAGNLYPESVWLGSGVTGGVNAWISEAGFPVLQGPDLLWTTGSAFSPVPTSGSYLELQPDPNILEAIGLDAAYVSGAPFANTTTVAATLADFGYNPLSTWASPTLEGTWTFHNIYTGAATGETVTIYSVPEPSQLVSVAAVGAMFGAWRLRKLRRGREAAGEAIAG